MFVSCFVLIVAPNQGENLGHFFNDVLWPSWGLIEAKLKESGKSALTFQSAHDGFGLWKYLSNNEFEDMDAEFEGVRCYEQLAFSALDTHRYEYGHHVQPSIPSPHRNPLPP